jgi:undecaprenyl-diphosphatase
MHYGQIIILAVIQGLAELLPISSSAHVILAEHAMGLDPSTPELTFLLVMLHTGTMFAVLFYFWPRWKPLLLPRTPAERAERFHFAKMIVIASACSAVIVLGLKFGIEKWLLERVLHHEKGEIEHLFKNLPLIGTCLLAVGVLIIAAGMRPVPEKGAPLTTRSSCLIGLIQGLCVPFRGFSRSGATISTAMFCGVGQRLAEEFSFALAVVLTPAAIALELYRLLQVWKGSAEKKLEDLLTPGLAGMVFSCLAGLLALRILSAVLERGRWKYFGYYCIVAAIVVFVVSMKSSG